MFLERESNHFVCATMPKSANASLRQIIYYRPTMQWRDSVYYEPSPMYKKLLFKVNVCVQASHYHKEGVAQIRRSGTVKPA